MADGRTGKQARGGHASRGQRTTNTRHTASRRADGRANARASERTGGRVSARARGLAKWRASERTATDEEHNRRSLTRFCDFWLPVIKNLRFTRGLSNSRLDFDDRRGTRIFDHRACRQNLASISTLFARIDDFWPQIWETLFGNLFPIPARGLFCEEASRRSLIFDTGPGTIP